MKIDNFILSVITISDELIGKVANSCSVSVEKVKEYLQDSQQDDMLLAAFLSYGVSPFNKFFPKSDFWTSKMSVGPYYSKEEAESHRFDIAGYEGVYGVEIEERFWYVSYFVVGDEAKRKRSFGPYFCKEEAESCKNYVADWKNIYDIYIEERPSELNASL